MADVYGTLLWQATRAAALARDKGCVASWLLGGPCSDDLHAHHIVPVEERPDLAYELDNVITLCSSHHPRIEALRRAILRARGWRRCTHDHRYPGARAECERRLNRDLLAA